MIGRKLESFQTIIGGRNKAERPLKPNPGKKDRPDNQSNTKLQLVVAEHLDHFIEIAFLDGAMFIGRDDCEQILKKGPLVFGMWKELSHMVFEEAQPVGIRHLLEDLEHLVIRLKAILFHNLLQLRHLDDAVDASGAEQHEDLELFLGKMFLKFSVHID